MIISSESETDNNKIRIPFTNKNIGRKAVISVFLLCFILLFIVQNLIFIKNDTFPQRSDGHFHRSLLYYDQIFNNIDGELWRNSYPPLFFLLPQPLYKIMGLTTDAPRVALTLLSVIFLLAMFGIGYELGGAYSGAAVMSLAASSPLILNLSRSYLPEFPQTAATAMCFYFLLKSEGYKQRLSSLLFGVVLAFSFMIKWSSAFFLLLPVLWFLIPSIFKSKKSTLAFVLFLIPASISGIGIFLFYNNIVPAASGFPPDLIKYYFPFVLLPAAIASIMILIIDRKFKVMEDYCKSGVSSVINFSWSAIIFAVLTAPWFFWAGMSIHRKYEILMGEPRRLDENLMSLKYVFTTGFNFLLPLMAAGIIFIVLTRKDIFRRLVIPTNILVLAPAMYRLTNSDPRYLLSFVIFFAALGGFWVCETGRFKGIITAVIMSVSLISMLSGTLISANLPFYQPTGPLLSPLPPVKNPYDISQVIEFLAPSAGNNWKKFIIYEKKDPPIDTEYIEFEAFKKGKRLFPLFRYNEQDESYRFVKDFERMSLPPAEVEPEKIDFAFLAALKRDDRKVKSILREKLPPNDRKSLEEWKPGEPVPANLKVSTAKILNEIIRGDSIYDSNLFSDVPLHPVIIRIAEEEPYGEQLAYTNMMLLNEALDRCLMSGGEEALWKGLNDVDDVLILHKEGDSIGFIVQTIKKVYPDVEFRENRFAVGADYCITVFRLNRRK